MFLSSQSLSATSSDLQTILDFLVSLQKSGLSHSSVRVYLAAISGYHPRIDGFSGFFATAC